MRTIVAIAALALLQTPASPVQDTAQFQWMRRIKIGPAPETLTCAVVPPALFHEAAPALRDVRLFANGQEIPFAQEESYDEQSLASGITQPSDRSFFDTVMTARTANRDGKQTTLFRLPARIPVERIALTSPATQNLPLEIHASIASDPSLAENISGKIPAGGQVFPVTLGANLQQDAIVEVAVATDKPLQLSLQMRRRWLCFEPQNKVSTLQLLYGSPTLSAPEYTFANALTMPEHPAMATIGPQQEAPKHPTPDSLSQYRLRLLLTLGAVILLLPIAGIALITKHLRRR